MRVLPLLAAALLLASPAFAAHVVDQKDMQFSETELAIPAGDAVEFTNSDPMTHDLSVTGPDGSMMSSNMVKPGEKVDISFPKPGEYKIRCLIHPKMKMTVTVN